VKILAALKRIKHLDRKIEKTRARIGAWCSYIVEAKEGDAPPDIPYSAEDLRRMRQQITDWTFEKARIRHALHVTNMETKLPYNGQELSIDELLILQKVVLPEQLKVLQSLRRKEKRGGFGQHDSIKSWVELQYDPKERDLEIEKVEYEIEKLDELLDSANIETEVIGL
jgi:hypothetical protein